MQLQTAYQWLILSNEECPSSYVLYETKLSVKASQSGLNYEWSRSSLSISPAISWKWNTSKWHVLFLPTTPGLMIQTSKFIRCCSQMRTKYMQDLVYIILWKVLTLLQYISLSAFSSVISNYKWQSTAGQAVEIENHKQHVCGRIQFPANGRRYLRQ